MEESKYVKLNNLYKSLKQLDLDILAKFNNGEITDADYFLYGIQNDIISNNLNILINYLTGNIESVGVDNSCRIILEALTILAMEANGDISQIQKSIYRYSYAYVDLANFKLMTTKEQLQGEQFKDIKSDRNKCTKYIKKHFGCEYDDIIKQESGVDDPCFYLKKNLKDKISFAKLIDKYFPQDMSIGQLYEFFSIMIHPRCELDPETEKATMDVHQHFVDDVLDTVVNFLSNSNLLPKPDNSNDFNDDFFYNPLLANNVHNVKEMEFAFNLLIKSICNLPDGFDWFSWFFLEKTKYLVLDMMTSLSLGYTEHVVASFKPFIELFSIFYSINTCEETEFEYLKRSYWISSRIQFNEHIKKCNIPASNRNYIEELQSLYNDYYAARYNVSTFSKFYDKYLHNSLYFLDNSKKSFSKFVREAIDGIAIDELQCKELMTLYKISKDMAHASGYSFNATVDLVQVTSHRVVYATFFVIYQFLLNVIATLKEHNIDLDLSVIIYAIELHMEIQLDAISSIYQKHDSMSD
ncbi:MAG: hypothetical protein K2O39_00970 [Clostridiales bacterium]|nr:hypothetical protein [Clostridiales bacterium]